MNPSFPPEGPRYRSQPLSPVSPKPIHFPSPSNNPVLQNQMDPVFNDTATYLPIKLSPQTSNPNGPQYHEGSVSRSPRVFDGTIKGSTFESVDVQTSAGSDDDFTESIYADSRDGTNNEATSTIPFLSQSDHTAENAAQRTSELVSADAQAESAPMQVSEPLSDNAATTKIDPSVIGVTAQEPQGKEAQRDQQYENVSRINASGPETGGVDLQALLYDLSASIASASPVPGVTAPTTNIHQPETTITPVQQPPTASSTSLYPAAISLPPRPPPLQNLVNHPQGVDIRSYRLHEKPASTPKYAPPPGTSLRPPGNVPPPLITGAPGTTLGSNGLPPPPVPTFQQPPPSATQSQQGRLSPSYLNREPLERRDSEDSKREDEDIPWGPEVQKVYDAFLQDERQYVTEGQWDKFPPMSRLFIGNLPTEKVTKRDLFHVFHKHGKLAQVSIKQAYGFIQYLEASSCYHALQAEQGVAIRGRKIHLEISKPQRNTKNQGNGGDARTRNRRSRSPDYTRGGTGVGNQRGTDHYRGGGNNNRQRARDDYRPGRSPSPPLRGGRNNNRGRDRSAVRYNGRRRSRSPSPYRNGRNRSPTPKRDLDDECPLPRRNPRDVPDVQIIARDELDRNFLGYVEKTFEGRGLQCNVLILSPRLNEAAVVRRQIIEGVQAVMKLNRTVQATQKFPLSVFDRSAGANNVRFEGLSPNSCNKIPILNPDSYLLEYNNLDLHICVELVVRAKQQSQRPKQDPAAYAASQYGLPVVQTQQQPLQQAQSHYPPPQQQPHQIGAQPNYSHLLSSLDPALQQLLGQVQATPQPSQQSQFPYPNPPPQQQQPPPTTDLARILASAGVPPPQPQSYQHPPHHQPQTQHTNLATNPAFASLFNNTGAARPQQLPTPQHQQQRYQTQHQQPQQQQQQQPQPQSVPDMSNIMAQLARYGR